MILFSMLQKNEKPEIEDAKFEDSEDTQVILCDVDEIGHGVCESLPAEAKTKEFRSLMNLSSKLTQAYLYRDTQCDSFIQKMQRSGRVYQSL